MKTYLSLAQLIIAFLLVGAILLQQRGTALGSSFGQKGGFYATRRGLEKKILWLTVVLAILFVGTAILNLVI